MRRKADNFYWSSTKVNTANYCDMRYYLRYVRGGALPLRLSAYVRGSLYHGLIENFWKKLGAPNEIKRNKEGKITSKKKYSNAQEFADYAKGKWTSIIIADDKIGDSKEKIAWTYEGEGWVILNSLSKTCIPLFNYLLQEGKPLFTETPFDFNVAKERFKGRIDEIRLVEGKIIIRDYKTGRPWLKEMKLKHDPQLTLYNVGLCSLVKFNPEVASALGLEGKFDDFMAGGKFVSPSVEEQFFMIDALGIPPEKVKSMPDVVNRTARIDENFYEVISMVKGVKKAVKEGNIYPERGKKCDDCDMKHVCDKELMNAGSGFCFDKKDNLLMDFMAPAYTRKEVEHDPPISSAASQKKFRFKYKCGGIVCGSKPN